MAWPTITIPITNLDASTDNPGNARADIKQIADNVNLIKDARADADGIASLGSDSKVPLAELPTIPATQGGTGQSGGYSVGDILYATAAGTLSKLAAASAGYVLTSNGAGVAPSWQASGSGLQSGTRMLFQQTSAPTGWTKETGAAYNNVSMRIVTGTVSNGGTHDFTTVFAASKSTDAFTLTTSHMPYHDHAGTWYSYSGINAGGGLADLAITGKVNSGPAWRVVTGTHRVAGNGSGGAHSHTIQNFNLKYRDFIIATKD